MKIYGERAPYDKMMARATKLCWVKQGGKILKVMPTLSKRTSMRGNVYWVRCWHVLWEHPITHVIQWHRLDWQPHGHSFRVEAPSWNNTPPQAFEILQ